MEKNEDDTALIFDGNYYINLFVAADDTVIEYSEGIPD